MTTDTNNPHNFLQLKKKTYSVWGKKILFKNEITFQESKDKELPLKEKKAKETKHKEFVEKRRKCIKDEFSIVKEALNKI